MILPLYLFGVSGSHHFSLAVPCVGMYSRFHKRLSANLDLVFVEVPAFSVVKVVVTVYGGEEFFEVFVFR